MWSMEKDPPTRMLKFYNAIRYPDRDCCRWCGSEDITGITAAPTKAGRVETEIGWYICLDCARRANLIW